MALGGGPISEAFEDSRESRAHWSLFTPHQVGVALSMGFCVHLLCSFGVSHSLMLGDVRIEVVSRVVLFGKGIPGFVLASLAVSWFSHGLRVRNHVIGRLGGATLGCFGGGTAGQGALISAHGGVV